MKLRPDDSKDSDPLSGNRFFFRPLHIDFDAYTEGDQEYKKELSRVLIDSLIELRRSLTEAIQQNNPTLFFEATHKTMVTLSILADKEFNEIIEKMKRHVVNVDNGGFDTLDLNHFHDVCDLIVISLRKEFNRQEN
jgi:hypothetical protein